MNYVDRVIEEFFPRPDAFDRSRGVQTSGTRSLILKRIFSRDCRRYQPVNEQWFNEAVKDVPRWTFIDVGCGRGKPLILAHESGFRKLMGVELSSTLCRTARRNLGKLGIEANIFCQDATSFTFPDEPCVVFFYNPFGPQIMQRVLARLSDAPRVLVYVNPLHQEAFHQFTLSRRSANHCVYLNANVPPMPVLAADAVAVGV